MIQLETFNQLRPYLFAIAYRMLGTVMDAEDMVQETFLRWQRLEAHEAQSPQAYLTAVITRLCIDQLRLARTKREMYVGPWLPEPVVTAVNTPTVEDMVTLSESLSMAFLVLLESLSPTERAVFLLRQVFDYEYQEIAHIVNKSEANCRQMVRRARQRLDADKPRFDVSQQQQEALVTQFAQACAEGDMDGLLDILAEDIVVWSDGGGKVAAAKKPIHGRQKAGRFFMAIARQASPQVVSRFVYVNGRLGIAVYHDKQPILVIAFAIENGRIQAIHNIRNPDKLQNTPYFPAE